jgi:hypothetical protein
MAGGGIWRRCRAGGDSAGLGRRIADGRAADFAGAGCVGKRTAVWLRHDEPHVSGGDAGGLAEISAGGGCACWRLVLAGGYVAS